jgi:hypothetical protein
MAWLNEMRANRNNWGNVEGLHVERNHLVGCSNLDIIDYQIVITSYRTGILVARFLAGRSCGGNELKDTTI